MFIILILIADHAQDIQEGMEVTQVDPDQARILPRPGLLHAQYWPHLYKSLLVIFCPTLPWFLCAKNARREVEAGNNLGYKVISVMAIFRTGG